MSEWISVEDRLPEQDSEILVTSYRFQDPSEGRFYCVSIRVGDDYLEWDGNENRFNDAIYPITHWQPLPEPPE